MTSKSAHVVDGEASESDSELDLDKTQEAEPRNVTKGFVVPGEAPESDDECKIRTPSKTTEDLPLHSAYPPVSLSKIHNSLLHQKLWECNVSLRATLEGLLRNTTEISVEKLSGADKTLLSVQESMRATNASLTLAKARLKQIHAELEKANCSDALPTVKIK